MTYTTIQDAPMGTRSNGLRSGTGKISWSESVEMSSGQHTDTCPAQLEMVARLASQRLRQSVGMEPETTSPQMKRRAMCYVSCSSQKGLLVPTSHMSCFTLTG